jgi:hypothetical protein
MIEHSLAFGIGPTTAAMVGDRFCYHGRGIAAL